MIKGAAIFAAGSGLGLVVGGVWGLLMGFSVADRVNLTRSMQSAATETITVDAEAAE